MSNILDDIINFNSFDYQNNIYIFNKNINSISYPDSDSNICYSIEDNSFWFQHRNTILQNVISNYSQKNDTIIDVGGGNGYVSAGLKSVGFQTVVLVEPMLLGALNARKRGLDHIFCGLFNHETVFPGKVPAVGLFDVLEHIEDDEAFLKDIYTLLEKDGLVYITVPAYQYLYSGEDRRVGHYRRYNYKQLSSKLKNAGYKIKYGTYFFWFLPLPILVIRKWLNKAQTASDTAKKIHVMPKIIDTIIKTVLSVENSMIKQHKSIPFGGSLLIVAQK